MCIIIVDEKNILSKITYVFSSMQIWDTLMYCVNLEAY
jgi:hypothetical protein